MKVSGITVIATVTLSVIINAGVLAGEYSAVNGSYILVADNSDSDDAGDKSDSKSGAGKDKKEKSDGNESNSDKTSGKVREWINKHREPEEKPKTAPGGIRG